MSMILAKDRPDLVKRVRILLDGVDVTADCYGFNVEDGAVGLYRRSPTGHRVVEYLCPLCGGVQPRTGMMARCSTCATDMEPRVVRSLQRGRVEVIPVSPEEVIT